MKTISFFGGCLLGLWLLAGQVVCSQSLVSDDEPGASAGRGAATYPGWQPYTGTIPAGTIPFYEVDQVRYVCRGRYNTGTHPGKVVDRGCNIGWGGAEVVLTQYEILVDDPARPTFTWTRWQGRIPDNAVFGGVECNAGDNCNNRLFVGMGTYDGYNRQVGKIMSHTNRLNFGYGGAEIADRVPAFILTTRDSRFSRRATCIDSCTE
jgi:Protein of unknown function (DUF3421)